MAGLAAEHRNNLYMIEAARVGIHKPILAALYAVHQQPSLSDGERGLGISPANRISLSQVDTLPEQVQFAANTIRSLTDNLVSRGWQSTDLWDAQQGRYTDAFLRAIAQGFAPPPSDTVSARLETSNFEALRQAYLDDLATDFCHAKLPGNLAYLDTALLALVDRIPQHYRGLPHQREALLEAVRIWRNLSTRDSAIAALEITLSPTGGAGQVANEAHLDAPLLQFVQRISNNYTGLPYHREALIRLVQLWRQLDSREEAIASLASDASPQTDPQEIDPALIAFVQRVPQHYQGLGNQRQALTEGFRLWQQLGSRAQTLQALGVNPEVIAQPNPDRDTLAGVATQIDRQLLEFVRRIPTDYQGTDRQRAALVTMVQLWRGLSTREQTIAALVEDLKRMAQAPRNSPDAMPRPQPALLPQRPARWTPNNIQLAASIIPNGNFTWSEATHGGTRMPPDQATVDAIVRIATLAQQARDRIGRPFIVTSWYRPPAINARVGGASQSRHIVGDAIDFYCEGLTGNQLYWALDPWWPGGLGRYTNFPALSHIDARGYRARWLH